MRVIAFIALLVVCATATPRLKRSFKGQDDTEPRNRVGERHHAGPQVSKDEDVDDPAEGQEEEDFNPQPISASEFKEQMEEMIGEVNAAKAKLEETAWAAGALWENATEESMAEVVRKFEAHDEHTRPLFDKLAGRLVRLMFRLYAGGEGFSDADRCSATTKYFHNELKDPEDPEQRKEYMKAMAGSIWVDLWCFSGIYDQVNTIDTELMTSDEYTEAHAAYLVSYFLTDLHLVRQNTERFNDAVVEAYDKLGNDDDETVEEEERQLKSLLKRLLMKTRGIKK